MEELVWRPRVPPGYRFVPTPKELIRYYLNPWATGRLPAESLGVVCVADIYSADPDTLTSRFAHLGHDGNWYFLCVNRWKGGKAGTRMNRCVHGGGTWHGSSKRKPIGGDGHRQGLEYRTGAGDDKKTEWIMEEFGTNLSEAADGEGVKVICKVHRTPRAAAAAAAAATEEEERQETDKVGFKRPKLHEENGLAAASAAQSPDDVECSYASKFQAAPVNAAAEEERRETNESWSERPQLYQEHGLAGGLVAPSPAETGCYYASTTWLQPMMEQSTRCYCARVDGGVGSQGQQEPLAVQSAHMEWHQFPEMDYGFEITAEDGQLNDWMISTFSCLKSSDGVEDDDDRRGDTAVS